MTSEGKPVPSVTKRLLNSGSQLPSFRRNGIFYVLLALFLYIIVVTRPQQTMVLSRMMEVPQIQRIPSNDYQEISKVEVKSKKLEQKPDWDTLDGIGFEFEENKPIVMDPRFYDMLKLPQCDLTKDKVPSKINIKEAMNQFQQCVRPIVERWRGDIKSMNTKFSETRLCEAAFKDMDVIPMTNLHETKWAILPHCREENIMVTIGIGHDTYGEERLNRQIDIAWIDIEGGEFEFLDQFYRGGPMDEKGIVICQFNLEVHSKFNPPGAQVFHDFVFRILDDKRYIFTKVLNTDVGIHRMFFVNVEDEKCVRKFLQ
ncbi:hypothetical protein L3Y34_017395 [Caenorhabditis briggsae]|uniref:Methyltransferase FkbM domain-containing protein n=1 Tax=Caenorhabditis briggsae TaxID=6238 RepID=A0AAE9ITQ6_CAEBR|nr:hypothetical protein L3Y34_017395 [Caenorhabditis briggsae]